MLRIEPGIQSGKVLKRSNEQTCGQDQYHAQGYFREYENLPFPLTAAANGTGSAFRERRAQIDGGGFECREKAEQQAGGERNAKHNCRDSQIEMHRSPDLKLTRIQREEAL